MIEIDGSYLEGGGQILRTSLGLSALTGQAFSITGIRKGRCNPGLQPQHLHAVKAAQQLCNADVLGDSIGSQELVFRPKKLESKDVHVDIGTAGSITLLLQSVLLPAAFGTKESSFTITGGTDVQWSQPYDYFSNVVLGYLEQYAHCKVKLIRRGYYPKGGGQIQCLVKPRMPLDSSFPGFLERARETMPPMDLTEREEVAAVCGVSHASSILKGVAERQESAAKRVLEKLSCPVSIKTEYSQSFCPGSGITLWATFSQKDAWPVVLGADALGNKGKRAELVGEEAAHNLLKEIESGASVDKYLADQLLPLAAFLPSVKYKASKVTDHCKTNMYTIEKFLQVKFSVEGNVVSRVA